MKQITRIPKIILIIPIRVSKENQRVSIEYPRVSIEYQSVSI